MALTQEMFRFVTTRRPERAIMSRLASRLIRDLRPATSASMLVQLFGSGSYESHLAIANGFAASTDFMDADDPMMVALEPIAAFLRERLAPEAVLTDLAGDFRGAFPRFAQLLDHAPPAELALAVRALNGRLWDSLYAQTIRGCDRYVSTHALADGLRVFHVLRLLWMSGQAHLSTWAGGPFDDYDLLIDLDAALSVAGDGAPDDPSPPDFGPLHQIATQLAGIQQTAQAIDQLVSGGGTHVVAVDGQPHTVLTPAAIDALGHPPVLVGIDLAHAPIEPLRRRLTQDHATATLKRDRLLAALVDPGGAHALQRVSANVLVAQPNPNPPAATLASLGAPNGVFRVPLAVGAMKPPVVGDLLLVEQDLRRYELGELADVETIMRGERREHTVRKINRTSQTTTTQTAFEQEQSSSLKTDERFALSTQAQQTAEQSLGIQAGVNVSGKFGPVQVGASVNASFNTSKSSSQSTSQDYAKTVTEEATQRVMSSIKESSSITILSETQDTSLRGFNNEKGATHVNGLYRWIDKIYDARLLNYGRRLMLTLAVPEPAAFYRGLIQQQTTEAMAELVEPVPPSGIDRFSGEVPADGAPFQGIESYLDLDEANYAKLAALYDVGVDPPPPPTLTGSKAFTHPDAMQAKSMPEHDFGSELSYMSADNTLTVDPSYRMTHLAVFAPKGSAGGFDSYVDALKLGEDGKGDEDILLVQVGNRTFNLTAAKGDNGDKIVVTNFNTWFEIKDEDDSFGGLVQPAIPVTITALFEGMLTFTVLYKAVLTDAAYQAWQASTYATIIGGYNAKRQAYDQARAVAESQAQSASDAKTLTLRDDQYRSIEQAELKRGCIDLMSQGSATGRTSIAVDEAGTPTIVYDPVAGAALGNWRAPLANGAVAEFFEQAFAWEDMTYQFHPYYWAAQERWATLAQAGSTDAVFEQFLRSGSASVVVPVRPGYERPVIFFLKTALIWGGGYLPLFTSPDMLDVYADVELGQQFDPPLQVGDSWEIRLPTTLVMLQEDDTLPEFPAAESTPPAPPASEPVPDERVPF